MKKPLLAAMLLVASFQLHAQIATPDKIYPELFKAVQMGKVFADGKTFVDCVPKRDPDDINAEYRKTMKAPPADFSLRKFVEDNFEVPAPPQVKAMTSEADAVAHIENLWPVLTRQPDKPVKGSSRINMPFPYVVPGGRFGEMYYWDSYFTMLGLKESGKADLLESMVKNFAYIIDTYGHIPNSTRSYHLSRSQPPFFAMMVALLADVKGNAAYAQFLPQMEKEHAFWMAGAEKLKPGEQGTRVVRMPDGALLNRYRDDSDDPRQESYKEDVETTDAAWKLSLGTVTYKNAAQQRKAEEEFRSNMYRNLRSAAESGFDFSNRWFTDGRNLTSIDVINKVAVDLNSLMYRMETVISTAYATLPAGSPAKAAENTKRSGEYLKMANDRKKAINAWCWNESKGIYADYDLVKGATGQQTDVAGMFPLFLKAAEPARAARMKDAAIRDLLKPGGFVTNPVDAKQQWDAPNGWAPMQWVAIIGLENYGFFPEARDAAKRWTDLNRTVYKNTGKFTEKYNVVNLGVEAGGGEYPSQDGFGWSNGVFLALTRKYDLAGN